MHIIAIANQKGGCGKTTTSINLAAALGQRDQRVLLIDMDPQGHASLGLGQASTDLYGLYEVFTHQSSLLDVVIADVTEGVDLVPATISLAAVQQLFSDRPGRERQLLDHLRPLGDYYDYALIDCPPSLGLLSINALRAAHQVLIPVDTSLYALDGIQCLQDIVDLLNEKYDLEIPLKALPTMLDARTRIGQQLLQELKELPGIGLCGARIRSSVRVREAAYYGRSLLDFAPSSTAGRDYAQLAEELLTGHALTTQVKVLQSAASGDKPDVAISSPLLARSAQSLREVVLDYQQRECERVQIAGDFNDWLPDNGVETRVEGNVIHKVLRVEPGAYEYRVIIDGVWQQDPTNPHEVPNRLGGANSLLRV